MIKYSICLSLSDLFHLACCCKWQNFLSFHGWLVLHLEKEMATHSSVLAWRIPGTVESGGLPSMGSPRIGHDWSDLAAAAAVLHWMCVCDLSSFICRWALRLLPYLDSRSKRVSFQINACVASGYRPRSGTAGSYGSFVFSFWFKKFLLVFLTLKYILLPINLLSLLTRDTLQLVLGLSCSQNLSLAGFFRNNRCFQLWSNMHNRKHLLSLPFGEMYCSVVIRMFTPWPREDTKERWLSTSQEERIQKKPTSNLI